jgi:hypothetical protein
MIAMIAMRRFSGVPMVWKGGDHVSKMIAR